MFLTARHGMKIGSLLLILSAGLLTACGNRSLSRSTSFDQADANGLAVIGFVDQGGGNVIIGKFDPETRKITGVNRIGGSWSGLGGKAELSAGQDGFILTNALGTERFRIYRLTPGEYALVMMQGTHSGVGRQTLENTALVDLDEMVVRDSTPVFSVRAGKVIYVGDLIANYGSFPASLTIGADANGMQKFLDEFPHIKTQPVEAELVRRFKAQ